MIDVEFAPDAILRARGINKNFGAVVALDPGGILLFGDRLQQLRHTRHRRRRAEAGRRAS
jgi:hypothetical protein